MQNLWCAVWLAAGVTVASCGFPQPADVPACAVSADCRTAAAPLCDPSAGVCVGCLDAASCATDKPVCDADTRVCRACVQHSDCASQVCADDGTCVAETSIAHAAPSGSDAAECTELAPCTLARALAITPARGYILLAPGMHRIAGTISVGGKRALVGRGEARPVITSATTGPLFTIAVSSEVTYDHVQLSGARDGTSPATGDAIQCDGSSGSGVRAVRLVDAVVTQNAGSGVLARGCSVFARRSAFTGNGGSGIRTTDSGGAIDRCVFAGNTAYGVNLDAGLYSVTNSFIYRNGTGLEIYPSQPGNVVAFNTIADNMTGTSCISDGTSSGSFANNLIVRNMVATSGDTSCTFPGAVIVSDAAAVRFVHADAAPYDYHLATGSVAIDRALSAPQDHDFDGEPRPRGAAADVGADEVQ